MLLIMQQLYRLFKELLGLRASRIEGQSKHRHCLVFKLNSLEFSFFICPCALASYHLRALLPFCCNLEINYIYFCFTNKRKTIFLSANVEFSRIKLGIGSHVICYSDFSLTFINGNKSLHIPINRSHFSFLFILCDCVAASICICPSQIQQQQRE